MDGVNLVEVWRVLPSRSGPGSLEIGSALFSHLQWRETYLEGSSRNVSCGYVEVSILSRWDEQIGRYLPSADRSASWFPCICECRKPYSRLGA
jgi:hypothetical protein